MITGTHIGRAKIAPRTLSHTLTAWLLLAAAALPAAQGDLLLIVDNPTPVPLDDFATSCAALDNGLIAIGTQLDDTTAPDAGIVYLFDGDPQSPTFGDLVMEILNPAPNLNDFFGRSMSGLGTLLIVGAPNDGTTLFGAGIAYVFDCDPDSPSFGQLMTPIINPDAGFYDEFGAAVNITPGGYFMVGAYRDDRTNADDVGEAYVFDANPAGGNFGQHLLTLVNPTPADDEFYGFSVFGTEDHFFVGAYDNTAAVQAGTVYVYDAAPGPGFGNLVRTISNPFPFLMDRFGSAIAANDEVIVVGAADDLPGLGVGQAFLFNGDPLSPSFGNYIATLANPSPFDGDVMGAGVTLLGKKAIVSAYGNRMVFNALNINGAGTVYIFNADPLSPQVGMQIGSIPNPAPALNDNFGYSMAVTGNNLLIGAWNDSTESVANTGRAYIYEIDPPPATPTPTRTPTATPAPSPTPTAYPTPTALPPSPTPGGCCEGDANNSGSFVDAADFIAVQANFGAEVDPRDVGDANCSGGFVDAADFISVQSRFGFDCGSPPPTPTPQPATSPTVTPAPSVTASPIHSPTASPPPCCPGDANNSGSFVDAADFIAVQANFGADNGIGGPGDANCSGSFVDAADFIAVQASFGADCG